MKNFAVLFAVLALAACATKEPGKEIVINKPAAAASAPTVAIEQIDYECSKLAQYARSVATLRNSGVALQDVNLMLPFPTTFRNAPVIREVYNRADISPEAGEANSYRVCKAQTFEVMAEALVKADDAMNAAEAERLKAELAAKKAAAKKPLKLKLDPTARLKLDPNSGKK